MTDIRIVADRIANRWRNHEAHIGNRIPNDVREYCECVLAGSGMSRFGLDLLCRLVNERLQHSREYAELAKARGQS